ncbi:MAG: hypothetical protein J7J17_02780 [Hadesarchaea archaeon]|nr:hypothetical protein [Hadesarchaea archaeon]
MGAAITYGSLSPKKIKTVTTYMRLVSMTKHTSLVLHNEGDEELWAWAQYRAKVLKFKDTSEYMLRLVEKDRKGEIKWSKR